MNFIKQPNVFCLHYNVILTQKAPDITSVNLKRQYSFNMTVTQVLRKETLSQPTLYHFNQILNDVRLRMYSILDCVRYHFFP